MFQKIVFSQEATRETDVNDVVVADGYVIEAFVANLSVPTTALFDGEDFLVAESGFANTAEARVLRIKPNDEVEVVAQEGLEGPVTGLLVIDGDIFVSHKGKVSVVGEEGDLRDIVTDLPSQGDHHNNNLVLGQDGKIYLAQGTTTNAAVVGVDSYLFGWLQEGQDVHEVPCQDITVIGQNFETENPLTDERDDSVHTGAYKPFGVGNIPDEVIKGNIKCGGSVIRFNSDGSQLELVAWGLRNPFGLAVNEAGELWATSHGADVRGSRSVFNDPDYLVKVEHGAWYGWPDFFDGQPVTAPRFNAAGESKPEFLWKEHPPLSHPFMTFDSHTGVNGLAFSPGSEFGHEGDVFIAMFGTFAPATTGINISPAGFKVVKVDVDTKQTTDFVTNKVLGPSYINQTGGLDRPSDVLFGPDGALYIVDWGAATLTEKGLELVPETGVIWRVYKEGMVSRRPSGPLFVTADITSAQERKPLVQNVPELYQEVAPTVGILLVIMAVVVLGIIFMVRALRR